MHYYRGLEVWYVRASVCERSASECMCGPTMCRDGFDSLMAWVTSAKKKAAAHVKVISKAYKKKKPQPYHIQFFSGGECFDADCNLKSYAFWM